MLYCVVPHNSLVAIWLDERRESAAAAEKKSIIELKIVKNDGTIDERASERQREKERQKPKWLCTCTWTTTSGLFCCGQTDDQKCTLAFQPTTKKRRTNTFRRQFECNDLIFHWYFERISLCLFIILGTLSFCFALFLNFVYEINKKQKLKRESNNEKRWRRSSGSSSSSRKYDEKKSSDAKQRINR